MAKLSLRHIYKVYPNGVKAVNDFNMEIADKEFIVFVGPSGCGKSTTLRMIAGLEAITAGELFIGNELVNDMEPKDRDIAMVFQNYALYPHMTVYDNMAFGLRLRHVRPDEIHRKVLWAADVLKLTEFLNRKPRAMSGGQRQRVALGRAILRNPKVFLLDEPLSNLDAKLRTEMRAEIAKLHNELKTTFIYVTHDQVEAMTLGTRVVVMKLGFIQQIDTPQNLYEYPENKFVAGFIGTPQMNFFEATLRREKDRVFVKFDYCDNELVIPFEDMLKVKPSYFHGDKHVYVGLRCEDISLDPAVVKVSKNRMKVKVSHFEELGNETLVYGDLNMHGDGFIESSTRVIIKSYHGALNLKQGDVVEAAFNMKKAHYFDHDDEMTISPRVPTENVFDCEVQDGVLKFLGLNVKLPPAVKCSNLKKGELLIPSDAITVGSGDIPVTIKQIEDVKGVHLAYLMVGERTFFSIVDESVKAGDKTCIDIDYKKISIKENNQEVVSRLSSCDVFIGGFTNLENKGRSSDSLKNLRIRELKAKGAEINAALKHELATLGHKKYLLEELKIAHKKRMVELQDERIEKLATCTGLKRDKAEIKHHYCDLLNKECHSYNETVTRIKNSSETIDSAKAADAEARAKAEYAHYETIVKKYSEICNAGMLAHKAQNLADVKTHEERLKAQLAELQKKRAEALAKIADDEKNELLEAKNNGELTDDLKHKEVERIHLKYNDLRKDKKNEFAKKVDNAVTASKVFYVEINGHYILASTEIILKIVQALGVGVFSSNYRYEVPHDAYIMLKDGGIEATVDEVLDYGKEKFAKATAVDKTIYVKLTNEAKKGDVLHLSLDLKNVKIYENKFDIRLI